MYIIDLKERIKKLENHSCSIGLVIHIDAHLNIFLARFILFHNVVENHTDVNQVDCKANTDKPKEKIFSVYKKIVKLKGEICNAFLECQETFTTFFRIRIFTRKGILI